jgi:hypothetical protein
VEGDNEFWSTGGGDDITAGTGQNSFYIIGESVNGADEINFIDADDIFYFRTPFCSKYIQVNVGADVASEIDLSDGPFEVKIVKSASSGWCWRNCYEDWEGKICDDDNECFSVTLPGSSSDANCN